MILLITEALASNPHQKAYEALRVYDYFKARQIFYRSYSKQAEAASAFGIALISFRSDNPFHNLDTAAKYSQRAYLYFNTKPIALNFSGFIICDSSIRSLMDRVSALCFERAVAAKRVSSWEEFLRFNFLAPSNLRKEAVYLRDEMEFNEVFNQNKSHYTRSFLTTHPLSSFYSEALALLDRQTYEEATPNKTRIELTRFLEAYPKSPLRSSALEQLYKILRQSSDLQGLRDYVYNYSDAAQCREAWKLLFALSVKSYSDAELIRFLAQYPDFPLRNSILKELQYSSTHLLPIKMGDLSGYLDTTGHVVIVPQYDSVSSYSEGLAVVSRNDSVWYINKLNEAIFAQVYEDALPFQSGTAAVKLNGVWKFINRQGQVISPDYEEINELCEGIYVVKVSGRYGALNEFGQTRFDARFEYLSNFKNGVAIYRENDKYGFVSGDAYVHKPEYDWLSDFDSNGLALYKKSGHFGLVTNQGLVRLQAEYDQIIKLNRDYYMLVNNYLYGFYHASGCFMSPVVYDYQVEKSPDYYSDKNWFRLLKNKSMALMDANGAIRVNFGVYEDCGFFNSGLMRVRKKSKTGYVDRKLQTVIPLRYDWAEDFEDSLTLVRKSDVYEVLDTKGNSRFKTKTLVHRLGMKYFLVWKDGYQQLLNGKGDILYDQIQQVQNLGSGYLALLLKNQEIKLLRDETFVILNTKNPL